MKKYLLAPAAAMVIASPAQAEKQFDGFYAGVSIGYDFQARDADEFISFDRGSNGTFGESVTTAAGANAFSPGFCNGAATSPQNTNCRDDSDGVSFQGRFGYDRQIVDRRAKGTPLAG